LWVVNKFFKIHSSRSSATYFKRVQILCSKYQMLQLDQWETYLTYEQKYDAMFLKLMLYMDEM